MTTLVSPGEILPDALYTKAEFCRRVDWKQHAWRGARRNGMRVIETAGRTYVFGRDFLNYLDRISRDEVQA